jgi:cobalt/nickel transport system permease protein
MGLGEPFSQTAGPLRRVDARVKLLAAAGLSVLVCLLTDFRLLAVALAVSAVLLALARPRGGWLVRRMAAANTFVALIWATVPWTTPGAALAAWGPFAVSREGLLIAAAVTLKCNTIVALLIALCGTSRLHALAHALGRLGLPGKLVTAGYLTVRYVHLVHAEAVRMRHAAAVRGFRPGANLRTYRTFAAFVGTLLLRTHDRAGRVYDAMRCRGFSGRFPPPEAHRVGPADWVTAALLALAAGALGALQWIWMR